MLSTWFPRGVPIADGRPIVLCFPFAGAGASVYQPLAKHLGGAVQLCPVELAGRETRFRERRAVDVAALADRLIEVIDPLLDLPIVLFGHSVGGLVAFELASRMEEWGMPPRRLILSACGDGGSPIRRADITHMDDDAFVAAVRSWGGLPDAIVESPELRAIFVPILRDDLRVYFSFQYERPQELSVPITVLSGASDRSAPPSSMVGWQRATSAPCTAHTLDGADHFFLKTHARHLASIVLREAMLTSSCLHSPSTSLP